MSNFQPGDQVAGLAAFPNYDSELIEGEFVREDHIGVVVRVNNQDRPTFRAPTFRTIITKTAKLIEQAELSDFDRGYTQAVSDFDEAELRVQALAEDQSPRESVLAEASRLIAGDRNRAYGSPTQNFTNTAELWTTLLRHKLAPGEVVTPDEVGTLMVALKLARTVAQPKRDNFTDMAGYAACAYEAAVEGGRIDG